MRDRYEWTDSGIFDRLRGCWRTWVGIDGGTWCAEDWKELMMNAINSDPRCQAHDVSETEHEYEAGEEGCVVCGGGVCHYLHRASEIKRP